MKPQTERLEDDLLFANEPSDSFAAQAADLIPSSVDEPAAHADDDAVPVANFVASPIEEIPPPPIHIDIPLKTDSPPSGGSPTCGSPKTVEGFVTSVELNAPEESFNTNVAINQTTDYFSAGLEQSSGPFSVYVSSSPEPGSIETPPQQQQSAIQEATPEAPPVQDSIVSPGLAQEIHFPENPSVEIVHAQSMVEVITPGSPIQIDSPLKDEEGKPIAIPDIMTQSMTGDTHPDMFSPPSDTISAQLADQFENKSEPYFQISEPYNTFDSTNEDLFKNIPEANLLGNQELPVMSPVAVDNEETLIVQQTDFLTTENEEVLNASIESDSKPLVNEKESSKNLEAFNLQEILPSPFDAPVFATNEPDLVKDIEPPQVELELSPSAFSPMDKIQQEFEQIEQAADEVIAPKILEEVPVVDPNEILAPIANSAPVEEEKQEPPVASPVIKPEVEKLKKEAPKAAPRTTTATKPGLKTTTKSPATSKVPSAKEQPKEASKTAPKATRLSTSRTAPKPDITKKSIPATRTTTSTASRISTARATTSRVPSAKTSVVSSAPKTTATVTSRLTAKTQITRTLGSVKPSTTTARKPISATNTNSTSTLPKSATTRSTSSATSRQSMPAATTKRIPTSRPLSSTTRPTSTVTKDATKTTVAGATKTTTSSSSYGRRPISAPRPPQSTTKDAKNTTNKILSTSRTTTSTTSKISSSATRTSTTTTRTSLMNKRPTSASKTGLKSRSEGKASPKSATKPLTTRAVTNGENKIVEEEATCEVKEKQKEESTSSPPQADHLVIPHKTTESDAPVISDLPKEVLVNGDH